MSYSVGATDGQAAANKVAQSLLQPNSAVAAGSKAAATPASGSTSAAASQDITSNDFLTLLVTEMKNQDPTQPTDPNAYIQQLVGVNSLQQLIAINQELTPATTPTTTTGASSSTSAVSGTGAA
jgi:flagellar basal-body rod modification protein FlgD